MKNSKLITLLCSLSAKEIKQLSTYLEGQKDNNTHAYKFYNLLLKQHPVFKEDTIKKEKVYKKVFPNYPYMESKLSKLMHELTKYIEEYIVTANKNQNLIEENLLLLRFFYERNLDKYFISTSKELRSMLTKLPESSNKNIIKYKFAELITSFELKSNSRNANYQHVYSELIELTESEKLRWENLSMINLFPVLNDHIPNDIYYSVHKQLNILLKEKDDSLLNTILTNIETNIFRFDKEESREILKIVLDYSIQKVNNGSHNFYEYLLRIYKLFTLKDLILNDYGLINISTYKNYITVALKLGNIEDALDFLETYKDKLPAENKTDIYSFNKTNIWFEQGRYTDIAALLHSSHFTDIFYKINQKRLLIKTYFELNRTDSDYFTLLDAQINAFYKFIYIEKKIPEVYISANKNFIKFIKKIVSSVNNTTEKKKILQKIRSTPQLAERDWLEKIVPY